jgi:aromatase
MTAAQQTIHTEHAVRISAPTSVVYGLVADVTNWPQVFPPTVWVDHVDRTDDQERIRIWATANDEVKSWTSIRHLDAAAGRIEFRQEVSTPPVAAMGGTWIVSAVSATETSVTLEHDYAAVGDDADNQAWIAAAVDRNSRAELDALKTAAETGAAEESLVFSFADVLNVRGAAEDVFEFVDRADRWSERLPHVARVDLREDSAGVQTLEMDTRTPDGATHTTRSIRVCFPTRLIVYKQLVLPALLGLHTGQWTVESREDGSVDLTSRHTVTIRPDAVPTVLGEAATIATAKDFVRNALSGNSTATMRLARDFAESRARSTPAL